MKVERVSRSKVYFLRDDSVARIVAAEDRRSRSHEAPGSARFGRQISIEEELEEEESVCPQIILKQI